MSKELLRRGFKFAGSTFVTAFMQAVGMVDDHVKVVGNTGRESKCFETAPSSRHVT